MIVFVIQIVKCLNFTIMSVMKSTTKQNAILMEETVAFANGIC